MESCEHLGPIWSRYSFALTCPPGHISSAHRAGKHGVRVEMNVTAHQEKNKETKTGKRKQATDFKELCAALLWSFRGQHGEKMKGSAWVTWTLGKTNSHFDSTGTGSGTAPPR